MAFPVDAAPVSPADRGRWASLVPGFLIFLVLIGLAVLTKPLPEARQLPTGILHLRPDDRFKGLVIVGDRVWAGGRRSLLLADWKSGRELPLPSGTPTLTNIDAVAVDASGAIWVGHESGLHVLRDGRRETDMRMWPPRQDGAVPADTWLEVTAALPSARVLSLFPASDGAMWVGTWGGTGRFVQGVWKPFEQADKLAHPMVRTLLIDSRGGQWFGSYAAPAGGVSYFDGRTWRYFTSQEGNPETPPAGQASAGPRPGVRMPHNCVVAMGEDRQGNVWVGTGFFDRGGLTRFGDLASETPSVRHFLKADGLAGEKCRSVFQDRDGILWFGSEYNGLARFNGKTWRTFTEADGLGGNEVMAMAQDPDGNLWLGTSHGLTRIASAVLEAWQRDLPAAP